MSAARKPQKLCVVTIGCDQYLLPMTDGVRLVGIMTTAVPVSRQYVSPERYETSTRDLRVEMAAVRADQIVGPRSSSRRPFQLTHGDPA